MDWRPLLYGVLFFPVALFGALLTDSELLLVGAGFPCGFIAGHRTEGALWGFVFGLIAGWVIAFAVAAGGTYYILRNPPGGHLPGFGLVVLYVWSMLIAISGSLGGAFAGYVD